MLVIRELKSAREQGTRIIRDRKSIAWTSDVNNERKVLDSLKERRARLIKSEKASSFHPNESIGRKYLWIFHVGLSLPRLSPIWIVERKKNQCTSERFLRGKNISPCDAWKARRSRPFNCAFDPPSRASSMEEKQFFFSKFSSAAIFTSFNLCFK